ALTALICSPCMSCKVTTYYHFHRVGLAFVANGHIGQWRAYLPVGNYIFSSVQETGSYLVQHLSFIRDGPGQNHVKGRDTVSHHHYQILVCNSVHITYLSFIKARLVWKL